MPRATGTFEIASWNEETVEKIGEGKVTHAAVTQKFTGDIDGDGAVDWLMAYRADGTARIIGLQRVHGTIGGRTGTVTFETEGEFDGTIASGRWTVVPGTGLDDLAGLTGSGRFEAPHGPTATFQLDYETG